MHKKQIANAIMASFIAYSLLYFFCAFLVLARYRGGLLEHLVDTAPISFCTLGGWGLIIFLSDWMGIETPKLSKFYYAVMGLMIMSWIISVRGLANRVDWAGVLEFLDHSLVLLIWSLALRKMHRIHSPGHVQGNS